MSPCDMIKTKCKDLILNAKILFKYFNKKLDPAFPDKAPPCRVFCLKAMHTVPVGAFRSRVHILAGWPPQGAVTQGAVPGGSKDAPLLPGDPNCSSQSESEFAGVGLLKLCEGLAVPRLLSRPAGSRRGDFLPFGSCPTTLPRPGLLSPACRHVPRLSACSSRVLPRGCPPAPRGVFLAAVCLLLAGPSLCAETLFLCQQVAFAVATVGTRALRACRVHSLLTASPWAARRIRFRQQTAEDRGDRRGPGFRSRLVYNIVYEAFG